MRRISISLALLLLAIYGCTPLHAQVQGRALTDSLLKELPRQKEDTNKVNLLYELSWSYNQTDSGQSIKYALQSIDLANRLRWKTGISRAYSAIAVCYYYKSDYPKALEYYKKQLTISEAIGDKKNTANAFSNIGAIYLNQSDYRNALSYLFKALKIAEENGFKSLAATAANNIGGVYSYQNDVPMALKFFTESLTFNEQLGNNESVAAICCNIGNIYQNLGNYSRSLEYLFKAQKIAEDHSYKQYASAIHNKIGRVCECQKKYKEAVGHYEKSIKIAEETGNKSQIATSLRALGSLYLSIVTDTTLNPTVNRTKLVGNQAPRHSGKYQPAASIPLGKPALIKAAINYLEKGLHIALAINDRIVVMECNQELLRAFKLTGDYKKALLASDNYHSMKDSVYSIENKEQILKMGLKNDYDRQHLTDSLKTAGKEKIATINLQKQKTYTYLGMAGIMLLVGFSFFIFKERAKSEKLLLNILPTEVAKELKAKGRAEAKLINEVTVLFTDFKGFTALSEKLSPKELVSEINTCFSAFDNIMQNHGVEKIKTIGDAYMAAGGLPTPNKTNAMDVVKAALKIQDFMHRHKAEREAEGKLFFEIRIGVHTGPVVAGIVGIKKFAYDIWGDTVNTASRMESSGSVGMVNISETTYNLVKDKFTCEYRGEVEAKGKGVLKMYFVG